MLCIIQIRNNILQNHRFRLLNFVHICQSREISIYKSVNRFQINLVKHCYIKCCFTKINHQCHVISSWQRLTRHAYVNSPFNLIHLIIICERSLSTSTKWRLSCTIRPNTYELSCFSISILLINNEVLSVIQLGVPK